MTRVGLRLFLCSCVLVLTASCAAFVDADLIAPLVALTEHERAVVSAPSWVGAVAGAVAGVPFALVLLPVTLPVAVVEGDMALVLPFLPMFMTAEVGALLVGGPFWLLFGWW